MAHTSFIRYVVTNIFLLMLSFSLLPLTTPIALLLYIRASQLHPLHTLRKGRKTFIVSNPHMTKSLHIIRTLSKAGHRVITISNTLLPPAGALSRHSSQHFIVNTSPRSVHESELLDIVLKTKADAWIPVSGVQGADKDAEAAHILRNTTGIKCCAPMPEIVRRLDDKSRFIEICRGLGLDVPDTVEIRDVDEAVAFLHSLPVGKRYIVKCTSMDDAARGDMTLLPMATRELTEAFLMKKLEGDNASKSWVLQEFIGPPAKEYATHAVVANGRIAAFVTVDGGEMVMQYRAVHGDISLALRRWTEKLVDGLEIQEGHVSCDFLVSKHEEGLRVCAIECNPRVHTAVVVMKDEKIVEGYMDMFVEELDVDTDGSASMEAAKMTSIDDGIQGQKWWVAHELLTRPWGILSGRDAEFDPLDPIPWWWAYHIWWPSVFIGSLWTGRRWSRINVSTGKVFQSG